MKTASPLIWFGGKGKQAEIIINKMPGHKIYIEPFGGAAHVISQKPKINHEVYNDIDGTVVNFILQSIKNTEELIKRCAELPYSRELYEKYRREQLPKDPLEKAVRFFYLNRSAIAKGNADEVPKTGWRHSSSPGLNPAMGYLSACEKIRSFAKRMQGVMIEHLDYKTVIEKYDSKDALFYVDPPYIGREKFYAGGFTLNDHYELGELLNSIQGKVILSYYYDPIINEIYSHWNVEQHNTFKQVPKNKNENGQATELLIMNFETKQLSLF